MRLRRSDFAGLVQASKQQRNLRGRFHQLIYPVAKLSIGIDGSDPTLGGGLFDLLKRIVALGLQNQIALFFAVQPHEKIRHIVVHLPVVQVGDREAEAGVLGKGPHSLMRIQVVGG